MYSKKLVGRVQAPILRVGGFKDGEPEGWQFEKTKYCINVHDLMGQNIYMGYTFDELKAIYNLNNNIKTTAPQK